jgi:hypothetical protein
MAKLFPRTGNEEAATMQMQLVDRLPHKNLMWPDKVLEDVILLRVDAHIGLADLLWKQSQRDEADQHLKMALELAPNHPDALAVQKKRR